MNAIDLKRYREELLRLRGRLAREINCLATTVLSDAQAIGEHDRGVSETVEKELALEQTEEAIREQVVAALERMELGSYGNCECCGAPIGAARLRAIPYASCCVRCQDTQI